MTNRNIHSKLSFITMLIIGLVLILLCLAVWLVMKPANKIDNLRAAQGITVIKNNKEAPAVPANGVVAVLVNLGSPNLNAQEVLESAKIQITDARNKEQKEKFTVDLVADKSGDYQLQMKPKESEFVPGKYTVKASFNTPAGVRDIKQDFFWGVLAINPNKSIYQPGERANLALAVLDEEGNMVCNAEVELKIQNPNGEIKILSTKNGEIKVNAECQKKEKTQKPDYETNYQVNLEGLYQMTLTATTVRGKHTIQDYFEVSEKNPFEIERLTATRIYPVNEYEVLIKIKPENNFVGEVRESVPTNFKIKNSAGKIVKAQNKQEIVWQADWQAGKAYELNYSYLAPEKSPDFYLLGSLKIMSNNNLIFEQNRQWQIAVDVTAFNDTFTADTDMEIYRHTPETGGGYTTTTEVGRCQLWDDAGTDTLDAAQSGSTGGCGDSEGALYQTQSTISSSDYDVNVYQTNGDTVDDTNILACRIQDANNMYAVLWNEADTDLYKTTTAGGWAAIANTANKGVTDGSTVTLRCLGNTISVLVGGAVFNSLSVTDTSITSAGYAGIGMGAVIVSTQDVSAQSLDNFSVTTYALPVISSATDTPDPTNPSHSVTFTITWSDSDSTLVKAKVCQSSVFASQNCTDGYWATSTAFAATNPIILTYDVVVGDAGTTRDYTVYVCDNGGSCSTGTSGQFTVSGTSVLPHVKFR